MLPIIPLGNPSFTSKGAERKMRHPAVTDWDLVIWMSLPPGSIDCIFRDSAYSLPSYYILMKIYKCHILHMYLMKVLTPCSVVETHLNPNNQGQEPHIISSPFGTINVATASSEPEHFLSDAAVYIHINSRLTHDHITLQKYPMLILLSPTTPSGMFCD